MHVLRFSDLCAQGKVAGQRVFIRADLNVPQDDAGNITEDTRVRDTLRIVAEGGTPTYPRPSTLDTAAFADEAAALAEADVVRTQRWLDDLEQRLARVERRFPYRAERVFRRALRRGRR